MIATLWITSPSSSNRTFNSQYITSTILNFSMSFTFCPPHFLYASIAPSPPKTGEKPVVFVAGASGNVGRRLVKRLAEAGCNVRAGCRDVAKCRQLVGELNDAQHLVEYVPFDVTLKSQLPNAVAGANVVVSTLGAPFSWGGVDGIGIASLMTAAAKTSTVDQLIVVPSIGVGRPWAFPAALLNLFGGVLLFKDYSEQVLRRVARENGKKFLIVRPGGMERPTDDFYLTHNVRISPRNTLAGGLVSNMQIAQLITAAALNPEVADGKTVEVVAETSAPKVDYKTLLEKALVD